MQWLFNFVVARATPTMIATVGRGGYGAYFIYGSFCFSMFIFTWFFVPETKGISLERMDELFGQVPRIEGDVERDGPARDHSDSFDEKANVMVTHVEKKGGSS